MERHWFTKQLYVPPICRDMTLEVKKKYSVYRDVNKSSYPHKTEISSSTLDRVVGRNPAPYAESNSDLLEGIDKLTIPCRTVEAFYAISSYVDGYQDAQRAPKEGNDKKAVKQVPPALNFSLSRTFCSFIVIADSPETNDSEGV